MRVLTVVGNRPQFIKAAGVSGLLRRQHEEILVHTGQHYDDELSSIFFKEFDLPRPDYELEVGSDSHAAQTAAIMTGLEPVVQGTEPDLMLIYGDTNSTLAAALVCVKLRASLAHVEAGMRSFDRAMPEEVNRVVADRCSDLLFCPSSTAVENLSREGIESGVYEVGDVMVDVALKAAPLSERESAPLESLGLEEGEFFLVTAHRPANVDDAQGLERLVELIEALPGQVVFPAHPRTRSRLEAQGLLRRLQEGSGVTLTGGVGYLDFLRLLSGAKAVLTDSGGVQKEAYLFGTRCITLRDTTEWVETVEHGWNFLVGLDAESALAALERPLPDDRPELYGGGHAGERMVDVLSGWSERLAGG